MSQRSKVRDTLIYSRIEHKLLKSCVATFDKELLIGRTRFNDLSVDLSHPLASLKTCLFFQPKKDMLLYFYKNRTRVLQIFIWKYLLGNICQSI